MPNNNKNNRKNKSKGKKPIKANPKLLPPLPHQLLHLQTLSQEIHSLHSKKSSLPANHPVLNHSFDPDDIIKPIISTYFPIFFRLFDEKEEEHVKIWIAFNAALLKVWEWGDVETVQDDFWECVGEFFAVGEEDRVGKDIKRAV
ncbi:hypothetical protein TWF730_009973 [Orbilia blumenaviensis]|uniref:Defective in cullin neddylation protein n=1 Tax=Orbilia blumenaviensis TaxID=1796055 RepID=A0AAV9UWT8_9PEZI